MNTNGYHHQYASQPDAFTFIDAGVQPVPCNPKAYLMPNAAPRWFVRLLWALLAAAAFFASCAALRADPIQVPVEYRTDNRSDVGVCWWCSAQTLGNYTGITPLQNIVEQVLKANIGVKGGATQEAVDHWIKTLKLKPRFNPHGVSQAGVNWLCAQLDAGLPVIVSYRDGNYEDGTAAYHAVLLIEVTRQKVQFKTGVDYGVRYIDPNHKDKEDFYNWTWFYGAWTGRAYTFDPKEQAPELVRAPVQPRPRVMTNGQVLPGYVMPGVQTTVIPHVEIRQQMPPYQPHEIPYKIVNPTNQGGYTYVPSNQDIKDGIHRPDDQLRYGLYGEYQKPRAPFIVRIPEPGSSTLTINVPANTTVTVTTKKE